MQRITCHSAFRDPSVLFSYMEYKIKTVDDSSLLLKAQIFPCGNEESTKDEMKSDCCMDLSIETREVLSVLSLSKCSTVN